MSEAAFWAGQMGKLWADHADALDQQLEPAGQAGLEALRPQPDENILDLGCGSGAMTEKLCEAVGLGGRVTGVDISADQITVAKVRAGNERAEFVLGDAQTWRFAPETYDALFSRFGCMFFEDSDAAFRNLQIALKPGARLVLVAWCDLTLNPWAALPAAVGAKVLGPAKPVPAGHPGPFAWTSPSVFRKVLEGAGFQSLSWTEVKIVLRIGENTFDDPIKRGVRMLMSVGPLARRLKDEPNNSRLKVADLLAKELQPYVQDGWVCMPGLIWVVRAHKRP